jgi:hypothetical protein
LEDVFHPFIAISAELWMDIVAKQQKIFAFAIHETKIIQ